MSFDVSPIYLNTYDLLIRKVTTEKTDSYQPPKCMLSNIKDLKHSVGIVTRLKLDQRVFL